MSLPKVTYFVDTAPRGKKDGSNWENTIDLRFLLSETIGNMTTVVDACIYVKKGVYKFAGNVRLSPEVGSHNITIIGGQPHHLKCKETVKNPACHSVFLPDTNIFKYIFDLSDLNLFKMKNVTVKDGNAGGMYLESINEVCLINNNFLNNKLDTNSNVTTGAGLKLIDIANVKLNKLNVKHNMITYLKTDLTKTLLGAGIYLFSVNNVSINNSHVNCNEINNGDFCSGAGLYMDTNDLSSMIPVKICNSTFNKNIISGITNYGAGISFTDYGQDIRHISVELTNVQCNQNVINIIRYLQANTSTNYASGFSADYIQSVKIKHSEFNNNLIVDLQPLFSSDFFNKGVAIGMSNLINSLDISHSQISNNYINSQGRNLSGAIYANDTNANITHNKFINNNVGSGHLFFSTGSSLYLERKNHNVSNNKFIKNGELGSPAVIYFVNPTTPPITKDNLFKNNLTQKNIIIN